MDEQEAREREIFADFLAGTPIEDVAGELDRLMRVGARSRGCRSCPLFARGRPIAWPGRWLDIRWRREFYRDVRDDINSL